MFEFIDAPGPIREDIVRAFRDAWRHLAEPGTWWPAEDRHAIATVARAARSHTGSPVTHLSEVAHDAVTLLAATPAATTRSWVAAAVEDLGEERYVELLGVTTRLVAIDTFTRLMGCQLEPLPEPIPGEPTRSPADPRPAHTKSWIPLGNVLVPPFTLSLVPEENTITNQLAWALYMTDAEMDDPDFRRGELHRTQMELVASIVSYDNECFY